MLISFYCYSRFVFMSFLLFYMFNIFLYINQVKAFYEHILTKSATFLSIAEKLKINPN